ncbi:hypothetical protein [Kribbella sp. NPDC051770]|uniref:hypothetical protein n=1 Tax=Kribbella sp. NPDC051770 TaxID=3155413 RepID=UPI00343E9935
MGTRRILRVWAGSAAAAVVVGLVVGIVVGRQPTGCLPDADDCLAELRGLFFGLMTGVGVLPVAVLVSAWRARLAWPSMLGSVGAAALLNLAWINLTRDAWAAGLAVAAVVLALVTLAMTSRRGQAVEPDLTK